MEHNYYRPTRYMNYYIQTAYTEWYTVPFQPNHLGPLSFDLLQLSNKLPPAKLTYNMMTHHLYSVIFTCLSVSAPIREDTVSWVKLGVVSSSHCLASTMTSSLTSVSCCFHVAMPLCSIRCIVYTIRYITASTSRC